ncbi:sulfatase [Halosimplex salinum]|uniref:sulfatase n=1 Tax=Halosimplex salinum TaxID=1710538 RepID=UPI000F469CE5|nr:sulfatase [Halosimplex salinum]
MVTDSVVLITVDCLRADHVGCYGYERPTTPNIDDFAEGATVYEHGYANCPGTRWAFQALQSGVYTHQIDGIGVPKEAETLANQFQKQGYATGAFANNGFLSEEYDYDTGFDTFYGAEYFHEETPLLTKAGFYIRDLVDNETFSRRVLRPIYRELSKHSTGDGSNGFKPSNTDVDTVDPAIDWIREQQSNDRPFFAWIHLMDAHDPYARWDSHLQALRGDTSIEHAINGDDYVEVGKEPPQAVIDAYDSGIRSADEQIGRVLSLIDDETVVALTGDHGEEFGRYKSFHSASLYSSMTQVPLIVRSPNLPSTHIESHWAQHLDIPPTLLTAVNIDPPETWEGTPLQNMYVFSPG